ncbi:Retrovirus-related Pol poly from transposon [Paramuricea clavata]|uniref:Retrovirus-related Pol poly from transposon n=1 Tax=Paramuricea clavata TaxID=317549 RepID=A0A7D9IXT1_PARCT|nr:Retrovirus-related Pol poly from transposon [Paramuricea clavata]
MEHEPEQAVGQPAVYLSHNISPGATTFRPKKYSCEAAEKFKLWKEKYNNYFIISRLENENPALAMFKHSVGDEGLKVIKTFGCNEHENSSDWKVKIPVSVRDRFKVELQRLERLGVITPVEEPTEWVSQIVVATKKSGALRVYIDPKPLNEALKRERYQIPVIDDLLPDLSEARVFSKVDLASVFWHL